MLQILTIQGFTIDFECGSKDQECCMQMLNSEKGGIFTIKLAEWK